MLVSNCPWLKMSFSRLPIHNHSLEKPALPEGIYCAPLLKKRARKQEGYFRHGPVLFSLVGGQDLPEIQRVIILRRVDSPKLRREVFGVHRGLMDNTALEMIPR